MEQKDKFCSGMLQKDNCIKPWKHNTNLLSTVMGNLFWTCNFLNKIAILKIAISVLCILVYLVKNGSFSVSAFKYVMQLNVLLTQIGRV